jgi:hypothetical protein
MRFSRFAVFVASVAVVAAPAAAWLFPRALPIVALKQSLTREVALARADSFFRAHSLAPPRARTAIRFQSNDSLRTFVELAGGGDDSLNALVRGDDIAPYTWSVRAFAPGGVREARVQFAPDGRIIGFERKLADADQRPDVSVDSGQRLALDAIDTWIDDRADRWKPVSVSYEIKKISLRVDRTYTFERIDRRIGGAPIRAEVVIAGDTPARIRPFVEIPQSFKRRYAEMRSWNFLLAGLATLAMLGIAIVGIVALRRFARRRLVRWREPMRVGAVIGLLTLLAAINEIPGSWFSYDTAMAAATFWTMQIVLAVLFGVLTTLNVGFTLAAAEVSTRRAFPRHLDWWKLWRFRGTREVANQVGGGYAAAAIGFAYVAIFYFVTRKVFGWWVPGEVLDDPNEIASPMPWISGIAISVNAGVWEEALFRALPLSLLSLWAGERPSRRWCMAAGVVATAIVFGFGHASYESWPPYSRGVELFLEACVWAVLFINFGLLLTVVAHFLYDLVLFGLFAAQGSAIEYRVTAAIILLALLTPALVVAWRWMRQRGFTLAPEEARFAAWTPAEGEKEAVATAARRPGVFTSRSRRLAIAAAAAGVIVAVARPPQPTLGPRFTADRERAIQTADSMLIAHGGNPAGWKRLTIIGRDSLDAWQRFLRKYEDVTDVQRLASTYAPSTWWTVRYVHTTGTDAQRTEEWRIRVWPDGRPLDVRHIVADSAPGRSADSAALRRIALASLAREGINTSTLEESELEETARPARRDATVTYTDTAVKLADGAMARAWVQIAGDEPLVARRGVELSEQFLRNDRARQTNRIAIGGIALLLLLGLLIAGAITVARRSPIVLNDGTLDRRTSIIFVGALILLAMMAGLNSLPSRLASYDTAESWGNFIGLSVLQLLVVIPVALMIFGLWLALGAMRRRVGVPMLPDGPGRLTRRDMLIAGLGLGGIVYSTAQVGALFPQHGVPRVPTTVLNDAVPFLAGIPNIPTSALVMVALVGIPLLVVAGLTQRRSGRAMIGGILVALFGVVTWSFQNQNIDLAATVLAIAGIAVASIALVAWGAISAWSWIVAALTYQGLQGLRNAVYAPVWQERGAGALALLVAIALIAVIARRVGRTRPSPGIFV